MSFTVFFPKQGQEDGAYKYLEDEEDVYEVVKTEVRQCISDMGSSGYDLISPEFPWEASSGNTYASQEEMEVEENDDLLSDMEEYTHLCHEQGIDKAASLWAPEIFKDLWVRYRTGVGTGPEGEDTAIEDVTYSKLPDGAVIALKEEKD